MSRSHVIRKGFSFVEILMVVSIISSLSSIVGSSIQKQKVQAIAQATASTLTTASTEAFIYFEDHNSYENICNNESMIRILGNLNTRSPNNVSCRVGNELDGKDWGIASRNNDTYFTVGPHGSGKFDSQDNTTYGEKTSWENALLACENEGKKLPTPSQLLAVASIESTNSNKLFTGQIYWSSFDSANTGNGLGVVMNRGQGGISEAPKSQPRAVRCFK